MKAEKAEKPSLAPLVGLLVAPVVIAVRGWALALLWGWFVVPLGAPSIGIWHACGLAVLWLVWPYKQQRQNDESTKVFQDIWVSVLFSVVAAGLGWIYQSLM